MLTDVIRTEQQGFIQWGDITDNLMLVKKIIECCAETNAEAYCIIIDFKKVCDRIDRTTMIKCMRSMNINEYLIELIEVL